jgi:hypothetical protein
MSFQFLPFYKNANILLSIKEERVFLLFVGSVHREEERLCIGEGFGHKISAGMNSMCE